MTEQVIKEVSTSTPAPAELKREDLLINSPVIMDRDNVPPDLKKKDKTVPHYLRASTRSCHDNCKFGIRHSFESKKYWPVRRAPLRSTSTGNVERDRDEIVQPQRSGARNKDQKLKISHVKDGSVHASAMPGFTNPKAPLEILSDHPESTPCAEELPPEASEPVVAETLSAAAECLIISHDDVSDFGDGESSDGAVSIELEMPLAIQDSEESDEHIEDDILPTNNVCEVGEQSLVDHVPDQLINKGANSEKTTLPTVMASEKKHGQAENGTKSESSCKEFIKPKAKATSSVTRNTTSGLNSGRTSQQKPGGTACSTAVESFSRPKIVRKNADASAPTKFSNPVKKFSSTVASVVPKVKDIKVPSSAYAKASSAEPASLVNLKASTAKNAPSPSLSSEKQTDRKKTAKDHVKNAQVLQKKGEVKIMTGPVKVTRSVNMPAKSITSVKLRAVRKEKVAPPIKNSKKVSGTENSAANAKDAKEKILKTASPKVRKPEIHNKESRPRKEKPVTRRTAIARRPKPAAPIIPTSTATVTQPPPRKLTFRRGKVLNPDDSSSTTPRRLRFRPAMAAADASVRSRCGRVTSGRRSSGCSNAAGERDAAGASRAAEVVVLRRRQDGGGGGDGKRQEQVLLNNVIEETASRLVAEAKKSKVKALVGAFETVISLQEGGKAAPPAVAGAAAP